MSEHSLRETVRALLNEQIDVEINLLADRGGDTEAQMRVRQGIVQGLKRAGIILNNVYRDLHG
jgi:hypothetical protein